MKRPSRGTFQYSRLLHYANNRTKASRIVLVRWKIFHTS